MTLEFKRQTSRSTKQDSTTNISLYMKDLQFSVCTSEYWGQYDLRPRDEPLIELELFGKNYRMTLSSFKKKLRKVLK